MAEQNDYGPKILEIIQKNGPTTPRELVKRLGQNTFIMGAILSQLSSTNKLKITHIKIGGTPAYYLSGQENQLVALKKFLGQNEQNAFELLETEKVLSDEKQSMQIKISLRNLKDFAKEIHAELHNKKYVFWKWYQISDEAAIEKIKSELANVSEEIEQNKKINDQEQEEKSEIIEEGKEKIEAPIDQTAAEQIPQTTQIQEDNQEAKETQKEEIMEIEEKQEPAKEIISEAKQEQKEAAIAKKEDVIQKETILEEKAEIIEEKKEEIKKTPKEETQEIKNPIAPSEIEIKKEEIKKELDKKEPHLIGKLTELKSEIKKIEEKQKEIHKIPFFKRLENYFKENQIETKKMSETPKEKDYIITSPTPLGIKKYYSKAKPAHKIKKEDIESVIQKAKSKDLQPQILSDGELSKTAENYLSENKNVSFKNI